jgi:hypothetical protein
MSHPSLESLAQQAAAGDPTASDAFLTRLADVLWSLDEGVLDRVARCALDLKGQKANGAVPAGLPFPKSPPLSPELLEWARQQFTEEETVARLRELRANGGLSIDELLADLDPEAGGS